MTSVRGRRPGATVRMTAMLLIAFGLAGTTLLAPSHRGARAQEALPAAIVAGSCDDLGESEADLRPLSAAEGGALTSFTTIDVPIDDLTGGDYAVVIGDLDEPETCGEIGGDGDDVYVPMVAVTESDLGGVAWLHDREGRTQVSLFLGENLSGGNAAPIDEPTAEPTGEPNPPVDETPEPSDGETTTYTSPTFGYTVTYDTDVWLVTVDTTDVTPDGPSDYFVLNSQDGDVVVEFTSINGSPDTTAAVLVERMTENLGPDLGAVASAIHEDEDGNPIQGDDADHAFVALDLTFEDANGQYTTTFSIVAWERGAPGEMLAMILQTLEPNFDRWTPEREKLEGGVVIPD